MKNRTGKVKNGSIELPQELRSTWENADVYITGERDRISIKRLSTPSLSSMLDEMNKAAKGLSNDDLNDALTSARKGS